MLYFPSPQHLLTREVRLAMLRLHPSASAMTKPPTPNDLQPTHPPRAPYSAPRLQEFGTFAALTRRVGTMGMLADKSGGGTNKTS